MFSRSDETIYRDKDELLLADAALSINSPYPLILRPERSCDVIISYDFTARDTDDMMPFKVYVVKLLYIKMSFFIKIIKYA